MNNTWPYSTKKFALITLFTSLLITIGLKLGLPVFFTENKALIAKILKIALFTCLFIFIRSAEKIEDEYTQQCRYKAFQHAFSTTFIYGIFISNKTTSGSFFTTIDMILLYQILLYIIVFYLYKSGIEKIKE